MTSEERKCFYKELMALAIPLALLGCFVLHWTVMLIYCVMCMDEIVKLPFIRPHYNRYIWIKNLTRENGSVKS